MDSEILRFSKLHIGLIEKERDYEIETIQSVLLVLQELQLQKLGFALVGMKVHQIAPWIGGRQLVIIKSSSDRDALSKTSLKIGDSVQLVVLDHVLPPQGKRSKEKQLPCGVIREMANESMTIAVSPKCRLPGRYAGLCTIKKDVNNVTYDRIRTALASLANYGSSRPRLHDVLFNNAEPLFRSPGGSPNTSYFDSSLNKVQKNAVRQALSACEIALIHGPPGTGKTHTLVEIIRQHVGQGKRALVCGASNVSVDNIALRLGKVPDLSFVRFGNPARMMSSVLKHSFYSVQERMRNTSSGVQPKKMSANASSKAIFNSASVVLSTLCGAGDNRLTALCPKFDVVIIDEASQATEGECWIAAIQAEKLILAGDHHQLPPTVLSLGKNAGKSGGKNSDLNLKLLEVSMFERVLSILGEKVSFMLTTQYRMHKRIMNVSSNMLYENRLIPDPKVANHLLSDIEGIQANKITSSALVLIDTTKKTGAIEGSGTTSKVYVSGRSNPIVVGGSMTNKGEVDLVFRHVERLIGFGMKAKDIAVITPYAGQVRLLKLRISKKYPNISIGMVDGFQGLEKEAVILSLVRSNSKQVVGFLKDYRRINVAITRARRHLCIIANKQTVAYKSDFLESFFKHLDKYATKLSG